METKQLGRTGINVSCIGLGGMPMSLVRKPDYSRRPPESQSIQVIHRALDLGVTLIDTADSYCRDESDKHHNEYLIHKALQQYEGETSHVIISTKGGFMRPKGSWTPNGNPNHLRQTIRASFEALGGSRPIDLWQYHWPDPNYTIEEALKPVKEAVDEGLIRFVGVSNFSVEQIKQARDVVEIVSVQNQYNLMARQPEQDGVLEYCETEGLTFFAYRPLGGRQSVGEFNNIPELTELAREKGVSVYCIALAWLRTKSPCIIPISGASQLSSIEDSVKAVEVKFSAEELQKIERGATSFKPLQKSRHRLPGIGLAKLTLRRLKRLEFLR